MNTKKQKETYQTIYSLRIRKALRDKGFEPLIESANPYVKGFKCWLYEDSEALQQAISDIMAGGQ